MRNCELFVGEKAPRHRLSKRLRINHNLMDYCSTVSFLLRYRQCSSIFMEDLVQLKNQRWRQKQGFQMNLKPMTASITNVKQIPMSSQINIKSLLLGSLTLLLSTRVPFPNKISCFVSTCVSLDNSFLSVRQECTLGPWKGSPFL